MFGPRHRGVDAPQSGPYYPFATPASTLCLQSHSARATTIPTVPSHPFQSCAPSPSTGTLISLEWQGRVASVASVQIHINGRRGKKLCPTFWDDYHRERFELWCSSLWRCCLLKQAGVQISCSVSVLPLIKTPGITGRTIGVCFGMWSVHHLPHCLKSSKSLFILMVT